MELSSLCWSLFRLVFHDLACLHSSNYSWTESKFTCNQTKTIAAFRWTRVHFYVPQQSLDESSDLPNKTDCPKKQTLVQMELSSPASPPLQHTNVKKPFCIINSWLDCEPTLCHTCSAEVSSVFTFGHAFCSSGPSQFGAGRRIRAGSQEGNHWVARSSK